MRFLSGYIERLDELDLEPGSFDVIVIQLCGKSLARQGSRAARRPALTQTGRRVLLFGCLCRPQAIEQGRGHLGVAKTVGPFGEGQI